jgi:hypothetical protein
MGLPAYTPSSSDKDATSAQTQQDKPVADQATGAGVNTGAGVTRAKTAAEEEADRLYEERMEEEYAKRDGGS